MMVMEYTTHATVDMSGANVRSTCEVDTSRMRASDERTSDRRAR